MGLVIAKADADLHSFVHDLRQADSDAVRWLLGQLYDTFAEQIEFHDTIVWLCAAVILSNPDQQVVTVAQDSLASLTERMISANNKSAFEIGDRIVSQVLAALSQQRADQPSRKLLDSGLRLHGILFSWYFLDSTSWAAEGLGSCPLEDLECLMQRIGFACKEETVSAHISNLVARLLTRAN